MNITGNCVSCHDGTQATGKHPAHISSTNACEDCHSTTTWVPVTRVDHTQVLGSCSTCHNGTTATGKNPGHFITSRECDVCHSTTAWLPHTYSHTGLTYEPLDHRAPLLCTACHRGNSEPVNWSFPAYQPDCAGCHANEYESGPHRKHGNPDVSYTVSELRNCSGSCHIYTDSTMTTIGTRRSGPEHRISDGGF